MIFTYLRDRKLRQELSTILLPNETIDLQDFETQEYRSDFHYQLAERTPSGRFHMIMENAPLRRLGKTIKRASIEICEIPITGFYGCQAGKSGTFKSLSEFADSLYVLDKDNDLFDIRSVRFQTSEDFVKNTKDFENRFRNDEKFTAYHFDWSNKYYFSACDGSHRFAAIYRQCREQGRDYSVRCELQTWSIDHAALEELKNDYLMMAVSESAIGKILEILCRFKIRYSTAEIGHTGLTAVSIEKTDQAVAGIFENWVDKNRKDGKSIAELSTLLTESNSKKYRMAA